MPQKIINVFSELNVLFLIILLYLIAFLTWTEDVSQGSNTCEDEIHFLYEKNGSPQYSRDSQAWDEDPTTKGKVISKSTSIAASSTKYDHFQGNLLLFFQGLKKTIRSHNTNTFQVK